MASEAQIYTLFSQRFTVANKLRRVMTSYTILAIGTHPDDIEVGCGGFLLQLARSGHQIFMCVVTHGEKGGKGLPDADVVPIRAAEARAAAAFLGAKDLWIGRFPDTQLQITNTMITWLETLITQLQPDIILGHSLHDEHHDHGVVATCTLEAGHSVPNMILYENPLTRTFDPNMFVDISRDIEIKLQLLMLHASQFARNTQVLHGIRSLAQRRAVHSRLPHTTFVEAFHIVRCQVSPALVLAS
jgi:LmbE family N-acetylglucosaminyl deacetylase